MSRSRRICNSTGGPKIHLKLGLLGVTMPLRRNLGAEGSVGLGGVPQPVDALGRWCSTGDRERRHSRRRRLHDRIAGAGLLLACSMSPVGHVLTAMAALSISGVDERAWRTTQEFVIKPYAVHLIPFAKFTQSDTSTV